MKSNLVGVPSIVFHRFQKLDKTYISEGEPLTQNFARVYLDLTPIHFICGRFPKTCPVVILPVIPRKQTFDQKLSKGMVIWLFSGWNG